MNTQRDYLFGLCAGFIAGIAAIPTLINLGRSSPTILLAAVIGLPVCALIGVWLGQFFSRLIPIAKQLVRFIIVGVMNTAVDFGILNLLSIATGIKAGAEAGGVNIVGFSVAFLNSYWWNKHWVFNKEQAAGVPLSQPVQSGNKEFLKFFAVNIIGILINSGVIILITTYIPTPAGISQTLWLNIAKVFATCVSLVWNFLGFKFVVFR